MKILFLIPYPLNESPSQRFRFEQYFTVLAQKGYEHQVQSFLNSKNWKLFFNKGNALQKSGVLLDGFLRRFLILFKVPFFDFVFIHRETTPIGPPIFEWIISNVLRKKIIYDFDDAIWLTDKVNEPSIEKKIRWRSKVSSICKWSYKISCGNEWLANYAVQFNKKVIVNPTTLDTEHVHIPTHKSVSDKITIGWTGSHSTLKYLQTLEPILQKIEKEEMVEIIVIADKKPALNLSSLHFIPWAKETEAIDLSKIDIGIMPLPDDEWSKGKCGFKALQYMAMEIPCIASPVGANTTIIQHGVNGFLASSDSDWIKFLKELIHHEALRKEFGKAGRKKVIENYSVLSNTSTFLSLFDV